MNWDDWDRKVTNRKHQNLLSGWNWLSMQKCLRMIWLQRALCCVLARRHSAEILPCDCTPPATTHANPTYLAICGYLPWSYLPTQRSLLRDNCGSLLIIDDIPFWTVIILGGIFLGGLVGFPWRTRRASFFSVILVPVRWHQKSKTTHLRVPRCRRCFFMFFPWACSTFLVTTPIVWPYHTHTTSTIYSI